MLRSVKGPTEALTSAINNNPALSSVMDMCKGRNPQEVFYEECRNRGVNPDDIINLLK